MDLFDAKRDVIQSLSEAGFDQSKLFIDDKTPDYFHPGKSGAIYINKNENKPVAYFGEIHPNIIKKLDIKTETLAIFEIYIDNIKKTEKKLKDQKLQYKFHFLQYIVVFLLFFLFLKMLHYLHVGVFE